MADDPATEATAAATTVEELFRSEELLVRRVGGHGSACCVVTFDSFTDHRTLDRPGFGEMFFNINAVDAIHVIPSDNRWYHYAEMEAAMARVRAATQHYGRVTTYGSSMGAYAAIRFAGLAGADAVLALSPQFSIDTATVRWETRWAEHAPFFNPRWERSLPFPRIADACVAYDPNDRDARHIAALSREFLFQARAMPDAGHPVTGCLAELGLLQELVLGMCRGDLENDRFWSKVAERLPSSSQSMITRAKRLPAWRRARRLALMRRAVATAPGDPAVYRCLGIELRKAKRFDEAFAMHQKSLELLPAHPNLLLEYSFTLAASGDVAGAVDVLETMRQQAGGAPVYQAHLASLRARLAGAPARTPRRFSWRRQHG